MSKKHETLHRITKHTSILFFLVVVVLSFVLINLVSGLVFSSHKIDLTQDQRYTLTAQTSQLLSDLPQPLKIRVYLSSAMSREYPLYAQYAQFVLHFLDKYRREAGGKIKIEIINPQPFSAQEDDAKRFGLRSFSSGSNNSENYYFGAVFSNPEGQTYTIPYFFSPRKNYLESDLSRGIANVSIRNPKNIGVASADIKVLDNSYRGQTNNLNWTFINLLQQDYNLVDVSTGSAEIPYNIDTMIVLAPRKVPSVFLYALDQFVMRGGNLLVFIDPDAESIPPASDFDQKEINNLNLLLQHWGINYQDNIVVGDQKLAVEIEITNQQNEVALRKYAPWFVLKNDNLNEVHPLTAGLNSVFLKTPGTLVLNDLADSKNIPLLISSDQTTVIHANIVKYGTKEEVIDFMETKDVTHILADLSEGKYQSAFSENPLKNTAATEKMLPYLSSSIEPAKIIVVADTDILDASNWADPEYVSGKDSSEILPLNNNFDFVQRAIDYLSGNNAMMTVGDKFVFDRSVNLKNQLQNNVAEFYATRYEELRKQVEKDLVTLNTSLRNVKNQEVTASVKNLNDLNQLRRNLQNSQDEMRRLEYQIKSEADEAIGFISILNVAIFPLLILLAFAIFGKIISRRKRRQAERLLKK